MNKLTWVHISDLHITHSRLLKYQNQNSYDTLAADIRLVLEEIGPSDIFFAITGDLVEKGDSEGFKRVNDYLNRLIKQISLDSKHVYIVPGNHDFQMKAVHSPPNKTAFKSFIKSFYGDTLQELYEEGVNTWKATYAGHNVGIVGIDTLFEANIEGALLHLSPSISDTQISKAIKSVEDAEIRIALLHHSPDSFSSRNPDVVERLFHYFDFILHGHGHDPSTKSIVSPDSGAMVISAGAIGGYSPNEHAYNIVSIDFENKSGSVYFRIFHQAECRWVADSFSYRNAESGKYQFLLPSRIAPELLPDEAITPTKPQEKVTILHLSDLQFGRHHAVEDRPPLYDNEGDYTVEIDKICADIRRTKNAHDLNVDFVAVTGDIAEWSQTTEYEVASAFLKAIISELDLSPHQVIIVPGNHDINWKLCESERLRCEAFNTDFKPPYFAKFEFYKKFIDDFYSNSSTTPPFEIKFTEDLFTIHPFPDKGIVFIGLNSTVMESDKEEDHYGYISVDQVRRALKSCERLPNSKNLLRIALMHHNFRRESTYDNENLRDADELQTPLLNGGVKVILHGHQHVPKSTALGVGNKIMHVIGTGSAGLDSETIPDNARRYQYIVFEGAKVYVYRRRFEKHQHDETGLGCWVPDPLPEDSPLQPVGRETYYFELSN